MEIKSLRLEWLWGIRNVYYDESHKVQEQALRLIDKAQDRRAEGKRLCSKVTELLNRYGKGHPRIAPMVAEAERVWDEGDKALAKGKKLYEEQMRLAKVAHTLWHEGISVSYGAVPVEWKSGKECLVDGRDLYKAEWVTGALERCKYKAEVAR